MNKPERHVEEFIKEIAELLKGGAQIDDCLISLLVAKIAIERAMTVLVDSRSNTDLDIPDGWPPE